MEPPPPNGPLTAERGQAGPLGLCAASAHRLTDPRAARCVGRRMRPGRTMSAESPPPIGRPIGARSGSPAGGWSDAMLPDVRRRVAPVVRSGRHPVAGQTESCTRPAPSRPSDQDHARSTGRRRTTNGIWLSNSSHYGLTAVRSGSGLAPRMEENASRHGATRSVPSMRTGSPFSATPDQPARGEDAPNRAQAWFTVGRGREAAWDHQIRTIYAPWPSPPARGPVNRPEARTRRTWTSAPRRSLLGGCTSSQ